MGKHFALTFQLPSYRLERSASKTSNRFSGMFSNTTNIGAIVLGLCCLLTIAYLIQVNNFSTKGYEISNLEKQISQLREEQKTLEVQTAELQSLQRIQSDPAIVNMVPVSTISYVQTTSLSQR